MDETKKTKDIADWYGGLEKKLPSYFVEYLKERLNNEKYYSSLEDYLQTTGAGAYISDNDWQITIPSLDHLKYLKNYIQNIKTEQ